MRIGETVYCARGKRETAAGDRRAEAVGGSEGKKSVGGRREGPGKTGSRNRANCINTLSMYQSRENGVR